MMVISNLMIKLKKEIKVIKYKIFVYLIFLFFYLVDIVCYNLCFCFYIWDYYLLI